MGYGYDYQAERQEIFTEGGQAIFLKIRDRCDGLLRLAGAFTLEQAICGKSSESFGGGTNWFHIACLDRMVELGELVEVGRCGPWAQDRVFARPSRR